MDILVQYYALSYYNHQPKSDDVMISLYKPVVYFDVLPYRDICTYWKLMISLQTIGIPH